MLEEIVALWQDAYHVGELHSLFSLQGRARAANAKFYLLVDQGLTDQVTSDLSTFRGIEKVFFKMSIKRAFTLSENEREGNFFYLCWRSI